MTVGYLLDLLIINEVRKEKLADTIDNDIVEDLNKQNGFLLKEIGRYLTEVGDGNRPGIFSKHKNYDKGVGEEENPNFIKVLYNLYQRHSELWDLEDVKRKGVERYSKEESDVAFLITQLNDLRHETKKRIDIYFKSEFTERKSH